MILREATIKYTGYDPDTLSKGSHKRICKSCNDCGRVGWVSFQSYKNLCRSCSLKGNKSPHYGKHKSKETKLKMSKSGKGKIISEKTKILWRRNRQGKIISLESKIKNSCSQQGIERAEWDGFIKDKPYCPKFNELCRESNREKYGRECFICGKDEEDNITSLDIHQKLSVHHIDMNKNQGCNDTDWSLVPVCLNCHGKIHNDLWKNRIKYLINKGSD